MLPAHSSNPGSFNQLVKQYKASTGGTQPFSVTVAGQPLCACIMHNVEFMSWFLINICI
jgi:hypothetical protein